MDKQMIPFVVFGLFMFLFLSCASTCSKNSSRTDGLYESATDKINKKQELTPSEAQRLSDIINWDESKKKYNIK